MLNVLAIIPARGNSKSIKNKNIISLNKQPLISYTIKAAIKSKIFRRIIVSTDSIRIKNISKKYGAEIPFMRPKKLSLDNTPTYPVIKYEYEKIKKFYNEDYDYVCVLQPTSPLRNFKHIKEAFSIISNNKIADSLISCQKLPHNFHPQKIMELDKKKYLKISDYKKLNNINRHGYKPYFARNGSAIYFMKPQILNKSLIGKKTILYEMDKISSLDIDDKFDLKIAETLLKII